LLKAEIEYCIEHEMVVCPSDFFIRRTAMLHFERPAINSFFDSVLMHLKTQLPNYIDFIEQDATEIKGIL